MYDSFNLYNSQYLGENTVHTGKSLQFFDVSVTDRRQISIN